MTPVRPPKTNDTRNPSAKTIGVSKVTDPRQSVPIQLKIFTPVGTAMSIVMRAKKGSSTDPVTYMWCAPHGHGESGDRDRRVDQRLVSEDRLTAEDREDLRHDAEERQSDDVDLGVAEEPEQVLPQQDTTVGGGRRCERRGCGPLQRAKIAAASTGNAIRMSRLVMSVFQEKIGMRHIVMPGARIVMIVVMKLTAPRMVPKPEIPSPTIQRFPTPRPARTTHRPAVDRRTIRRRPAPCGVRKPATANGRAEEEEPEGGTRSDAGRPRRGRRSATGRIALAKPGEERASRTSAA